MLCGYCLTSTSATGVRGSFSNVIIPGGLIQIHADFAEAL